MMLNEPAQSLLLALSMQQGRFFHNSEGVLRLELSLPLASLAWPLLEEPQLSLLGAAVPPSHLLLLDAWLPLPSQLFLLGSLPLPVPLPLLPVPLPLPSVPPRRLSLPPYLLSAPQDPWTPVLPSLRVLLSEDRSQSSPQPEELAAGCLELSEILLPPRDSRPPERPCFCGFLSEARSNTSSHSDETAADRSVATLPLSLAWMLLLMCLLLIESPASVRLYLRRCRQEAAVLSTALRCMLLLANCSAALQPAVSKDMCSLALCMGACRCARAYREHLSYWSSQLSSRSQDTPSPAK